MDDTRDWLSQHRAAIFAALPYPPAATHTFVDRAQRGYTTQMRTIWEHLRAAGPDIILFWEADFRPIKPVDVDAMAALLDDDPMLAQVALLRQPWFSNEIEHGGVIEALEAQGQAFTQYPTHIEHTAGWTGNPSLFRRRLATDRDWPDCAWSESTFGRALVTAGHRFAYYGPDRTPHVEHVGVRTEASRGY